MHAIVINKSSEIKRYMMYKYSIIYKKSPEKVIHVLTTKILKITILHTGLFSPHEIFYLLNLQIVLPHLEFTQTQLCLKKNN